MNEDATAHSVTPKKLSGSTATVDEDAVDLTAKNTIQSRAMKFLKPALTPVPAAVAGRSLVSNNASNNTISHNNSGNNSSRNSMRMVGAAGAVVSCSNILSPPLALPTTTATSSAATATAPPATTTATASNNTSYATMLPLRATKERTTMRYSTV